MKARLFYLLLFAVLILQNCQDSNEKPRLDQDALKSTLTTSSNFNSVVDLRVTSLKDGRNKYLALSNEERDELKAIMDKGGSAEELQKAQGFAKIADQNSAKIPLAYNMLIKELDAKYSYNESDLRELITSEVTSRIVVSNSNGRTAQMLCSTKCANGAEAYYWYMYDGCRNKYGIDCSQNASDAARNYYNGCMDGCGNPM
jgi:hypothetical protein